MAKFNLNDYDTVESRIRKFYEQHEDGRILTDMLSDPDKIEVAVVKAMLYIGDTLVATGLAFEREGSGMANNTAHLENCETSSIGRALANYNLSGNKRASREEMEKVDRGETQGQEMYNVLRKLIDDKKMDGTLDEKAHATAVAWLDGHAKTIPGMTAAKKSLDARFAEADPTNDEIADKAFDDNPESVDGQGEIF